MFPEPEPDDQWTVSVKDDVAHVAFSDANLSGVRTFRPGDQPNDTYDRIIANDGTVFVAVSRDGCTGCALCAVKCPFDAIAMRRIAEAPAAR